MSETSFPADANGDGVLNAQEHPGDTLALTVRTEHVEDAQPVFVLDASNAVVAEGVVTGGEATVLLAGALVQEEGSQALLLSVTNAAGFANNLGPDGEGNPSNPEARVTLRIDRRAPEVRLTCGGRFAGEQGFTFVAASNVHFFEGHDFGYVPDTVAGGDADVSCAAFVLGGAGGSAGLRYDTVALIPEAPLVDDVAYIESGDVSLPHGSSGSLVVEATDAAGNSVAETVAVAIDVQPPAAPAPISALRNTEQLSTRTVRVDVSWGASGDDGAIGEATAIDLRYRSAATFDEPVAGGPLLRIRDDESFFSPRSAQRELGLVTGGAAGSFSFHFHPWSAHSIAVRAVDDVGNYSVWSAASEQLVPAQQDSHAGWVSIANPEGGAGAVHFGASLAVGHLDLEGNEDFAVGSGSDVDASGNPTPSKVYVFRGQPQLDTPIAVNQVLVPPEAALQRFGADLADGLAESDGALFAPFLLVGAPGAFDGAGRALLYFGGNDGLDAALSATEPHVVDFRGPPGSGLGAGVHTLEHRIVALAAPDEALGRGRIYLFWNRTRAEWLSHPGGAIDPVSGTFVIPATAADRIVEGDACPYSALSPCGFGMWNRLALPKKHNEAQPTLVVSQPHNALSQLLHFPWSSLQTGPGVLTSAAASERITGGTDSNDARIEGLGTQIASASFGLVATYPRIGHVRIFGELTSYSNTPDRHVRSDPERGIGSALAVEQLNTHGAEELVLGERPSSAGNSVWILYAAAERPNLFDGVVGDGHHQSRLVGPPSFGSRIGTGHLNDIIDIDVVIGVPGVAASDPGAVRIYY